DPQFHLIARICQNELAVRFSFALRLGRSRMHLHMHARRDCAPACAGCRAANFSQCQQIHLDKSNIKRKWAVASAVLSGLFRLELIGSFALRIAHTTASVRRTVTRTLHLPYVSPASRMQRMRAPA